MGVSLFLGSHSMTADLARLATAERKRSADLVEIFSAIQGEGPRTGERHLFVRFLHCDMKCAYCDTPACHTPLDSWRLERTPGRRDFERRSNPEPLASLCDIVNLALRGPVRHAAVSLTGGEPLLQPWAIRDLAPVARAAGARVLLETDANLDGAFDSVRDCIDIVSMDWKIPSATGEEVRKDAHVRILDHARGIETYVKAVFAGSTPDHEILDAARTVARVRPEIPFILQPVSAFGTFKDTPTPSRVLEVQELAMAVHADVRVIPQVHRLSGQL